MARILAAAICGLLSVAGSAQAQDSPARDGPAGGTPLSAIDWLSDSVASPAALPVPPRSSASEPPVATSALPGTVTVEPLDRPDPSAAGLMRAESVGLPHALWSGLTGTEAAARFPRDPAALLPASRELLVSLLTVEAAAPVSDGEVLLLARIDTLLRLGDLPRAARLMEAAGLTDPEVFRRWFDTELLTGSGSRACDRLRALPDISPTYSARIFCLARGGDWHAAVLTLETAEALGVVTADEGTLLARFLDAELFELEEPLPRPEMPTPLTFAMYEAIGQAIPTATLPIAFAHSDLRPVTGWKARIEAAERLVAHGALPAETLFDIYRERQPAASGGVWERAEAVQELDAAFEDETVLDLGPALARAWTELHEVGLGLAFAQVYGAALADLPEGSAPAELVTRIGMLGGDARAFRRAPEIPELAPLARALAGGGAEPGAGTAPDPGPDALVEALAAGLAPAPVAGAAPAAGDLPPGLAILEAIGRIEAGRAGNYSDLADGLSALVAMGLGDAARQAAVQVALLGRRT